MKLIVISDSISFEKELKVLPLLFEEGLSIFHLRKPEWNDQKMFEYLMNVPEQYRDRIVIHSYFHLAKKFALRGVHMGFQSSKNHAEVIYPSFKKSASCHSYEEVRMAKQILPDLQYVFLSPIFDSISKPGYLSNFDQNELTHFVSEEKDVAVIALGGVTVSHVEECKKYGFDGVAVLGAIWTKSDPLNAFRKLQETCQ